MVTEIAMIEVAAGSEEAFEAAMRDGGVDALAACEGVQSVQFGRGLENPTKFAFVVVWDSTEAHDQARASDSFKRFRMALGSHGVSGTMEHFDLR